MLWHCWLGVRKSIRHIKSEWWGVGMVICLERGANSLHKVQLMLLPSQNPIIPCLIKIQTGFTGWASTRRNIHPVQKILIIKYYQLPPSTTIHSILLVQFRCLTVLFHNLSPGPLRSTSRSGTLYFILHTFLRSNNRMGYLYQNAQTFSCKGRILGVCSR